MAYYGTLSNCNTVAQPLCSAANSSNGSYGIFVTADAGTPNTCFYSMSNTITAPVAGTFSNNAQDNTNGYPLPVGKEVFISKQEFINAQGTPAARVGPDLVYVISTAVNNRVDFRVV